MQILNEIMHVNYLAQSLAKSKHSENKALGYAHTQKCTFNWHILLYIFYKYVYVCYTFLPFCYCENKWTSHLKWSQEALKGELLHTCRPQQEEMYLALSPTRESLLYTPQQEEERSSLCPATAQPMRNCHTRPMKSHRHHEFTVYSNKLPLKTVPPNFLLFSIKELSFPLFSRLAYGLP